MPAGEMRKRHSPTKGDGNRPDISKQSHTNTEPYSFWGHRNHDIFNLIALPFIVILNALCWHIDVLLDSFYNMLRAGGQDEEATPLISRAFHGDTFLALWYFFVFYLLVDMIWVIFAPHCVKSPTTIIVHHAVVLVFSMYPMYEPSVRNLFNACCSVELNTWFLIARRVFHKPEAGTTSPCYWMLLLMRKRAISILFYVTWVSIRVILYPLLLRIVVLSWWNQWEEDGSPFNLTLVSIPMHGMLCLMNLQWSFNLFMSKVASVRKLMSGERSGEIIDKGL